MVKAIWQGTDDELARLHGAIAHYCDCVPAMLGLPVQTCPAHAMLDEQSALDHLLYVLRVRGLFVRREFYATAAGGALGTPPPETGQRQGGSVTPPATPAKGGPDGATHCADPRA